MDSRCPRDGKVIEELGTYDPMVKETDARAILNGERIDYWLSVGALPTEKVGTLIKKYGTNGTRLEEQKVALERTKVRPQAPPPVPIPKPKKEEAPAEAEAAATSASTEATGEESAPSASEDSGTSNAAE
jgi:small subunit ribosomal protein S16